MTNGHEKSDPATVALKSTNNAERSAAEPMEPRAGTRGNTDQIATLRTPGREGAPQGLDRVRQTRRQHPRSEPNSGRPYVRICTGGPQ